MKNISMQVPNSEEEYKNLTKENRDNILQQYKEINSEMNGFIVRFIEDVVAPILVENPWIKELVLDPKYEYNDEGYAPQFIMPFINGEWWAPQEESDDVFEKIDYACADISSLLLEDVSIDVELAKTRYLATKLDEELPSQNKPSKPRFKT